MNTRNQMNTVTGNNEGSVMEIDYVEQFEAMVAQEEADAAIDEANSGDVEEYEPDYDYNENETYESPDDQVEYEEEYEPSEAEEGEAEYDVCEEEEPASPFPRYR